MLTLGKKTGSPKVSVLLRRALPAVLRIRDVYPGSRILIFTHPGSRIQKQVEKRGVKKNFLSNIFLQPQISQNVNYLILELLKKKNWAKFQRIMELFTQKVVTKLSKI